MKALLSWGAAFVAALVLTPVFGALARKAGLLDRPGGRKSHARPVPLLGGAAVLAGVLAGMLLGGAAREFVAILAGAGIVLAVGLADDIRALPVWAKLLAEFAAAGIVVWSGVQATFLLGVPYVTVPLTLLWIVGITNAFNFLDNMDGLSAGVACIASGIFAVLAFQTRQPAHAAAFAALSGAALGFLPYNFGRKKVFLGDAGALSIGFLLGCGSVAMTFYEYRGSALPLAAPLLVLAIPIFDTATVLWIRLKERRPLTRGDRRHFSHRLVALGMSERTAVLTIYLAAFSMGLGAMVLKDLSWPGGLVMLAQAAGVFAIVYMLSRAGGRRG